MATIDSIGKVITLAAKTGLFFAKADGHYDVREQEFIESYIAKLEAIGPVDEVRGSLESMLQLTPTLDEVVADTNALLADFNGFEQALIKATLIAFVKKVIACDGEKCEQEMKNFEAWKEAID
ncbi:MAG: hypothetical protein IJ202_10800 [Bacteroidales bacterium]|nr:hypothetical protein [Bacteroidales bacterium]